MTDTNMYNNVKDFRNLKVWQKTMDIISEVYKLTEKFPQKETYVLVPQILRACNSVGANIAEGNGQMYPKKEISFYNNALGSVAETRNWLYLAYKNNYITVEEFDSTDAALLEVTKMLYGCIKKAKTSLS